MLDQNVANIAFKEHHADILNWLGDMRIYPNSDKIPLYRSTRL